MKIVVFNAAWWYLRYSLIAAWKKKDFFFNKLMPLYLQVHIISTILLAKGKCASSFVSVLFFSPFAICSFCLITFTLLSFPSCILPSSVLVWITVSGCYREKREVNSLSPRLINNMTQKLTEWVWMVAKKEGDTLTSTTTTASTATAVVAAAVPFSLQLDLCNLGDKILVWPCAVSLFCLLFFNGVFLLLLVRHRWCNSWARKCFLVKEPCNRITLHVFQCRTCVHVRRWLSGWRRLRDLHTLTQTKQCLFQTCVSSVRGYVKRIHACVGMFFPRVHTWPCRRVLPCSPTPIGASAPPGF